MCDCPIIFRSNARIIIWSTLLPHLATVGIGMPESFHPPLIGLQAKRFFFDN
jgi:hypothetical protein